MTTVLVVDDNRDLADDLGEILECAGHTTSVCYGAADALRASARCPCFELALLDIRMHGMSGVQLGTVLLVGGHVHRCVFMTGSCSDRDMIEARRLSAYPVLEKPFDLQRIIELAS